MYRDIKVVLTDNNLNFYGLMNIKHCGYTEFYINSLIKEIIVDICGNEENFFEKFSEYISDMIEELDKRLKCDIDFVYYDTFMFNVDEVFEKEGRNL